MSTGARYVVGIDLGTTNTAVAYVDTTADDGYIHQLDIAQVIAPGEIAERSSLPSFLLLATEHEVSREALRLPWDQEPSAAVGVFARDRGAELPHRVVASAKSWLSHTGADRKAPILPWRGTEAEGAASEGERVSPVEASARYLRHLRAAWDHRMDAPLEQQEVLLAVPASFDAVARELTVEAARAAGLDHVTLIEEPQAAFYAWLAEAGDGWRDRLRAGDVVLVCDVGGGTTDFSLIEVVDEGGNLSLERVAVGDHILLGGDNMDLALAYAVTAKLGDKGKQLKPMQRRALVHACRRAKEELLAEDPPDSVPITILGTGSKLIGGTIKATLERADVEGLIDGFFPAVEADARPQARRAVGLKELGLPYAHDPAVTRHLAAFMTRHGRQPTAILWNGGVMKGTMLRGRVAQNLARWYGGQPLPTLGEADLDLAVSHGAAYYGLVRHGRGIRIRGGTARSYYIGVESAMPAIPGFAPPVKGLCVAAFGMEEGTSAELPDEELGLVVGETAEFRFFASTHRQDDAVGAVVDPDEAELRELDPVETTMPAEGGAREGDVVPVSLQSKVTEIGTLELWCVARDDSGRRWKLEYSVREHE
ncbi:MAG TPA: Hsp70 family protein [Kofleriaceae bacterium]|nr:Hsp70 family protein [Kofleriaceae bacterium]